MPPPSNIAELIAASGPVETTTSTLPNAITPSSNSPAGTSGTITPAPTGSMIRNISQTVQEREIIKTAPDLLVYLEGFPYLVNYFIGDPETNNPYTVVAFNDYVTAFNAGYDTENLVPSASFQINVPNHAKHLFQMPGGNNLIQTMMQVQVFAKGYYFGNDGSTLLRRVFKGMVSHISATDDGKMLAIQVQCSGTLHMLELMQVELAPAAISNSPMGMVPTKTNLAYCNPYLMIIDMFIRRLSTEGFYVHTVNQNSPGFGPLIKDPTDAYHEAVVQGYAPKWQQILENIQKDVHLYGVIYKDVGVTDTLALTNVSDVSGTQDQNKRSASDNKYPTDSEAAQLAHFSLASPTSGGAQYPAIRQYLPDMEIASVQLLNSKIVNRLDEVRQVVHTLLYEGYQDVDGKIIFKPPLYNLDVTNIGTSTNTTPAANSGSAGTTPPNSGTKAAPSSGVNQTNPVTEINATNNPFIIYLSEIINEQETEDQAAIRTTRMTVRGNYCPSFQFGGNEDFLETVEYIDIPKLQKFGLREEPTRSVGWFRDGDKFGLFAYAAAETVRANRGYRTYTCSIPMRPELKLGFPVFLPHRDMYGYIKSIQLQYSQGGQATMSVTLDALRRRPLIPTQSTNTKGAPITVFASQPDLVFQWTSAPPPPTSGQSPNTTSNFTYPQGSQLALGSSQSNPFTALSANSSNACLVPNTPNSPANIVGTPASIPTVPDQAPTAQEIALLKLQQTKIGSSWGTETDSPTACFRVQNDTYGPYIMPKKTGDQGTYGQPNGGGVFVKQRIVDSGYYHDIRRTMPFTDGKGYEVVSPFPWGRYITLRQAFKEFTQEGYIIPPTQPSSDTYIPPDMVQALLAAGLATPTGQGDTVTQLQTAMNQTALSADTTIIVLNYSVGQSSPSDSKLATTAQPDVNSAIQKLQGTITNTQQAIAVLVSGSISPTQATMEALAESQTPDPTANIGLTSKPSSKPKDLYPTTNQQGVK
jgi:hypothetical protein